MKRLLAMLLTLACLLTVPAAVTGCATGEDDPSAGTSTEGMTEGETEDLSYTDELATMDFGGKTVAILSGAQVGASDELLATELKNELINDAVYERNRVVENRLGVVLEVTTGGETDAYYVSNTIHNMITAGDDEYQIAGGCSYVVVQQAVKGDYLDLNHFEHLDLSKLYWSQGYNDMASWGGGHQFLATGAIALSLFRYMFVSLYNKARLEEYHVEDPFTLVQNGTWTIEKQMEITSGMYRDTDGDGKRSTKDFYGFVGGSFVSADCYWIASDCKVLTKDEDGYIVYDADVERMTEAMARVQSLYFEGDSYIFNDAASDISYSTNTIEFFSEGKCFMTNVMVTRLETGLREFDDDYGILPIPKFDAFQPEYHTCVQDQVTGYSVPTTVREDKQDMVGAVLECLASESHKTVVDAYYNTALSYRYLQNPESKIMLDLIYESVTFEIAQIYTTVVGGFLGNMRQVLASKKNTVASTFKKLEKSMTKSVNTVNKEYEKIVNR